jgi:hypothetical protein
LGKPEQADQWRAKLPETEAVEQWHSTPKMAPFSSVDRYNLATTQQPVISKFCEILIPLCKNLAETFFFL